MSERVNTAQWLENQKRWQIKVQKDGVRKTFTSTDPTRKGQREANAKADAWLRTGISPRQDRIKDVFLEYMEKKQGYSRTERAHIESVGKNWIIPYLGHIRINQLIDGDYQDMLDAALAKGLAKKSIQDIRGIMNKFLKWCRSKQYTSYRPDDVTIPHGAIEKGKLVPTIEELKVLFREDTTFLGGNGERVREPYIYAFRFQALTGLRPGELRGLRMEDIQGDLILIQRSINVYYEETQGKNKNARRGIPLTPAARKVLEEHLQAFPRSSGPIFDLPCATTYNKHLKKYCEANGITPMAPYTLRHVFVSVAKTLPEGEVKELVGHSRSMDTFGIYGHVLGGEDAELAVKLEAIFKKLLH